MSSPVYSLFVHHHIDTLVAALFGISALLAVAGIALWLRLAHLNRLYRRLTRGTSGGNLEEVLQRHLGTVQGVAAETERLKGELARVAERQQRCIQGIGLVRFDAFEEVGGQQSFAVVLLDAQRNGAAISSVYSRQDVRVYAKAIHGGQPSHPLTHEEQQAMTLAEGSHGSND